MFKVKHQINKTVYVGRAIEACESYKFHQQGIPLLASSRLLRTKGMGQIDLCRLQKESITWCGQIVEVKNQQKIHQRQIGRLHKARVFLEEMLQCPIGLSLISKN